MALFAVFVPFSGTAHAATLTFMDLDQETFTLPNGALNAITATFLDESGHTIDLGTGFLVDFEIISGPNADFNLGVRDFECFSNPTSGGTCTGIYFDNVGNGTDVICGWFSSDGDDDVYDPTGADADGGDCDTETANETEDGFDTNAVLIPGEHGNDITDVVNTTWQARTPTFLNVEPETDFSPNGSTHTLTASFFDQFGNSIDLAEEQLVDFEILGGSNANSIAGGRDLECPSNNPTVGGTCAMSYTDPAPFDANTSQDTICAWLSTDGDDDQYDPNGTAADGGDCLAEAPNETDTGLTPNGLVIPFQRGNDQTDVVTEQWVNDNSNQPPGGGINLGPITLNAEPESSSGPNGTQHQVTVTMTRSTGPVIGVVPSAQIAADGTGRAAGDVVNAAAGASPNFPAVPGAPAYSCTASNSSGVSTCTFNDPVATPTGTDTTIFFLNVGGGPGADPTDPQDAVQRTWTKAACADGLDNDSDGLTDGQDPGCEGDDSEEPVNVTRMNHPRIIGMNFSHTGFALNISGALSVTNGAFTDCISNRQLLVQHRERGTWVTKETPRTGPDGSYFASFTDRKGFYRVVADEVTMTNVTPHTEDVCLQASRTKYHKT